MDSSLSERLSKPNKIILNAPYSPEQPVTALIISIDAIVNGGDAGEGLPTPLFGGVAPLSGVGELQFTQLSHSSKKKKEKLDMARAESPAAQLIHTL